MTRTDLENGKYTIIIDGGYFRVLRYGEPWRDATGDNLLAACADEIENLRAQVAALRAGLDKAGVR